MCWDNNDYGWVRVTNALVVNAELVGLDGDTDRIIFCALRAAERTAYGRGRKSPDAPPAPVPAPAPATKTTPSLNERRPGDAAAKPVTRR